MPDAAEQKLYEKVVGAVERTLEAIALDPVHPLRGQFDVALADFVERLETSPGTIERAEEIKEDILGSPAVLDLSAKLWSDVRAALSRYAEEGAEAPPELERAIQSFGATVLADAELRSRIDKAVAGAVAGLAEKHRSHVGELITETVSRWGRGRDRAAAGASGGQGSPIRAHKRHSRGRAGGLVAASAAAGLVGTVGPGGRS